MSTYKILILSSLHVGKMKLQYFIFFYFLDEIKYNFGEWITSQYAGHGIYNAIVIKFIVDAEINCV